MLKRVTGQLLIILAGALILVTVVYAHGGDTDLIHSCVDRSGKIRIVAATTSCGDRESALDWNIQGPPGPQGPPGETGSGGLVVVDSDEGEVGFAISTNEVVRFVDPYWVIFTVSSRTLGVLQFSDNGGFQIWYESQDCSGTPFVESTGLFRQGYPSGTKIFYPGDPLQVRTFLSYRAAVWGIEPVNPGPCEEISQSPYVRMSGPVEWFDASEFIPPFRIAYP